MMLRRVTFPDLALRAKIRSRWESGEREMKRSGTPLGLIVVDYLKKAGIPEKDRKKQRYEQVGDIAKERVMHGQKDRIALPEGR